MASSLLTSRELILGKTLLGASTYEIPLTSRNLVLARVSALGGTTLKAYPLSSSNLLLSKVTLASRRTVSVNTHVSRNLVLQRTTLLGTLSSAVNYPSLVPTKLEFTPPSHLTTKHQSYSGETEIHVWADSPTDAKLSLTYENISDANAELFLTAWDNAFGIVKRLNLPTGMLNGFQADLSAFVLVAGQNLAWYFADVPRWSHSIKGYGNLQVNLNSRYYFNTSVVGGNAAFAAVPVVAESTNSYSSCDFINSTSFSTWSGTLVFSNITDPETVISWGATWNPNPDSSANTRALQLSKVGTAMTTLSPVNYRNFIYLLTKPNPLDPFAPGVVTCDNAGITAWRPVGQSYGSATGLPQYASPDENKNWQQFFYRFGASTSGYTGTRPDGNPGAYRVWDGNLSLIFGSFYLEGSYDFCGPANAVSAITVTTGCRAVYNDLGADYIYFPDSYDSGNNSRNYLDSDTYSIVFGASGRTGTIKFSAIDFKYHGGLSFSNGGTITIVVNPP